MRHNLLLSLKLRGHSRSPMNQSPDSPLCQIITSYPVTEQLRSATYSAANKADERHSYPGQPRSYCRQTRLFRSQRLAVWLTFTSKGWLAVCRLPSRRPCTYPSKVQNTSMGDTYLGNAENAVTSVTDKSRNIPFSLLLTPDLEAQTPRLIPAPRCARNW